MKIDIISVGKKNEKEIEILISDFEKRIKKYTDLRWYILKSFDDKDKNVQKKKESDSILKYLEKENSNSYVILLDEKGKNISSLNLSEIFEKKMNLGVEKIIFIIGGAFGVEESFFSKVDFIWSLSNLVFPHQIVRLILIEQIYRGFSILKGEKYHHK